MSYEGEGMGTRARRFLLDTFGFRGSRNVTAWLVRAGACCWWCRVCVPYAAGRVRMWGLHTSCFSRGPVDTQPARHTRSLLLDSLPACACLLQVAGVAAYYLFYLPEQQRVVEIQVRRRACWEA